MVIINIYTIMHARTRFDDDENQAYKWYLLRLWLDAEDFRKVPSEFCIFKTNGVPYQQGRRCTDDFKKLFKQARPGLLGIKPRKSLRELVKTTAQ